MTSNPRIGARVLILNPAGEVLLLNYRIREGLEVWIPPGGGLEGNETLAECALRELREETGIDTDGPLEAGWFHEDNYSGRVIHETYFVSRMTSVPTVVAGHHNTAPVEFLGYQWWSMQDIERDTSDAEFTPADLIERLRKLVG